MIKKIMLAVIAITFVTVAASARDKYVRNASVLPVAAQTTISNNFKAKVNVVKIDKDFGRVSEYDVVLTDGTEITFDRDGNWKEIEVGASKSVPSGLVPAAITDNVKKHQPKQKIVGIEKSSRGYDVELSNGVEMKFDTKGNFIRYDD